MFLATINKPQRLLYLAYIGRVRADELKAGREASLKLLADLPLDYRVLADFERMESMEADGVSELGKLMDISNEKGVELIVRVIPDPSKDVGLNILGLFHYKRQMQVVTCQTMEEAARALGI